MRPPAAVSAMEIVSWRDLRRVVTSSRISLSSAGGKLGVDIVVAVLVSGESESEGCLRVALL